MCPRQRGAAAGRNAVAGYGVKYYGHRKLFFLKRNKQNNSAEAEAKTDLTDFRSKGRHSRPGSMGEYPGMIFALLPQLVLVVFGFASGYGVREWIAQQRGQPATGKYYKENPSIRQLLGVRNN